MQCISKNLTYEVYSFAETYISVIQLIDFLGIVSIAQLLEVTVSEVLDDVVEVMSSNPAMGNKYFLHLPAYY